MEEVCPWCCTILRTSQDVSVLNPCGHRSCTGCYSVHNLPNAAPKCKVCDNYVSGITRTHVTDCIQEDEMNISFEKSAVPVIPRYDTEEREMKLQKIGHEGETPLMQHWLKDPEHGTYMSIGLLSDESRTPAIAEHIFGTSDTATNEGIHSCASSMNMMHRPT